jgi:fructose-bisphosphate aldolase class II
MPLTPTRDLVTVAAAARTGIAAFNVIHLETAEAFVDAAEQSNLPVILQLSQNCADYHGGLEPIALATLAIARASAVPVAVHLDHAESEDLAHQAIALGFGSIMFDGGALPYEDNVAVTARVARRAHAAGLFVEGELGEIGGKDGAHAPGVRTDPDEAREFVLTTGVDALAVAVGSSHAMAQRTATLDLDLIARLHAALPVPLVLHGSSGVADDDLVAAIEAGMTKINVSTHFSALFTRTVRAYLDADPTVVDSRRYVRTARDAVAVEAARLLSLVALRTTSTVAA